MKTPPIHSRERFSQIQRTVLLVIAVDAAGDGGVIVVTHVDDVVDADDQGHEEVDVLVVVDGEGEGVAHGDLPGDMTDFFAVKADMVVEAEDVAADHEVA